MSNGDAVRRGISFGGGDYDRAPDDDDEGGGGARRAITFGAGVPRQVDYSEPRRKPYVWVTWIRGLLAGDDHCEWAPWYKAHYKYQRTAEDSSRENQLSQWKADHGDLVRARALELEQGGWDVSLEEQNKYHVYGESATIGGCSDIVGFGFGGRVRIEDAKTGRRRDGDYWQVLIYAATQPLADRRMKDAVLSGGVVYRDGIREISEADIKTGRLQVFERIRLVGAGAEPKRTPSGRECGFCDIQCCPDRVVDLSASGETKEF